MASEEVIKVCTSKMKKAFEVFSNDLASLRTGRASISMLDIIKVDVYGQMMPINQLATISTPDPRTINVQVWDQNNVTLIDSTIKKSKLGVNPQIDGQLLRIPIPSLNEERRKELKKQLNNVPKLNFTLMCHKIDANKCKLSCGVKRMIQNGQGFATRLATGWKHFTPCTTQNKSFVCMNTLESSDEYSMATTD